MDCAGAFGISNDEFCITIKMMKSALQMMEFVLQLMKFVLQMMKFVLQMMKFVLQGRLALPGRRVFLHL